MSYAALGKNSSSGAKTSSASAGGSSYSYGAKKATGSSMTSGFTDAISTQASGSKSKPSASEQYQAQSSWTNPAKKPTSISSSSYGQNKTTNARDLINNSANKPQSYSYGGQQQQATNYDDLMGTLTKTQSKKANLKLVDQQANANQARAQQSQSKLASKYGKKENDGLGGIAEEHSESDSYDANYGQSNLHKSTYGGQNNQPREVFIQGPEWDSPVDTPRDNPLSIYDQSKNNQQSKNSYQSYTSKQPTTGQSAYQAQGKSTDLQFGAASNSNYLGISKQAKKPYGFNADIEEPSDPSNAPYDSYNAGYSKSGKYENSVFDKQNKQKKQLFDYDSGLSVSASDNENTYQSTNKQANNMSSKYGQQSTKPSGGYSLPNDDGTTNQGNYYGNYGVGSTNNQNFGQPNSNWSTQNQGAPNYGANTNNNLGTGNNTLNYNQQQNSYSGNNKQNNSNIAEYGVEFDEEEVDTPRNPRQAQIFEEMKKIWETASKTKILQLNTALKQNKLSTIKKLLNEQRPLLLFNYLKFEDDDIMAYVKFRQEDEIDKEIQQIWNTYINQGDLKIAFEKNSQSHSNRTMNYMKQFVNDKRKSYNSKPFDEADIEKFIKKKQAEQEKQKKQKNVMQEYKFGSLTKQNDNAYGNQQSYNTNQQPANNTYANNNNTANNTTETKPGKEPAQNIAHQELQEILDTHPKRLDYNDQLRNGKTLLFKAKMQQVRKEQYKLRFDDADILSFMSKKQQEQAFKEMQAIWDDNVDGLQNALENGWGSGRTAQDELASAIENFIKAERDKKIKAKKAGSNEKVEPFKTDDLKKFVKEKLEEFKKQGSEPNQIQMRDLQRIWTEWESNQYTGSDQSNGHFMNMRKSRDVEGLATMLLKKQRQMNKMSFQEAHLRWFINYCFKLIDQIQQFWEANKYSYTMSDYRDQQRCETAFIRNQGANDHLKKVISYEFELFFGSQTEEDDGELEEMQALILSQQPYGQDRIPDISTLKDIKQCWDQKFKNDGRFKYAFDSQDYKEMLEMLEQTWYQIFKGRNKRFPEEDARSFIKMKLPESTDPYKNNRQQQKIDINDFEPTSQQIQLVDRIWEENEDRLIEHIENNDIRAVEGLIQTFARTKLKPRDAELVQSIPEKYFEEEFRKKYKEYLFSKLQKFWDRPPPQLKNGLRAAYRSNDIPKITRILNKDRALENDMLLPYPEAYIKEFVELQQQKELQPKKGQSEKKETKKKKTNRFDDSDSEQDSRDNEYDKRDRQHSKTVTNKKSAKHNDFERDGGQRDRGGSQHSGYSGRLTDKERKRRQSVKHDAEDYDVKYQQSRKKEVVAAEFTDQRGRVHKKSKQTVKRESLKYTQDHPVLKADPRKVRDEKRKYNNQYDSVSQSSEIKSDYSFDKERNRASSQLEKKNQKMDKQKERGILKHRDSQDRRSLKYNQELRSSEDEEVYYNSYAHGAMKQFDDEFKFGKKNKNNKHTTSIQDDDYDERDRGKISSHRDGPYGSRSKNKMGKGQKSGQPKQDSRSKRRGTRDSESDSRSAAGSYKGETVSDASYGNERSKPKRRERSYTTKDDRRRTNDRKERGQRERYASQYQKPKRTVESMYARGHHRRNRSPSDSSGSRRSSSRADSSDGWSRHAKTTYRKMHSSVRFKAEPKAQTLIPRSPRPSDVSVSNVWESRLSVPSKRAPPGLGTVSRGASELAESSPKFTPNAVSKFTIDPLSTPLDINKEVSPAPTPQAKDVHISANEQKQMDNDFNRNLKSMQQWQQQKRTKTEVLDLTDYYNCLTECSYYRDLMDFIATDEKFQMLASKAPKLYKHIENFENVIEAQLQICQWKPQENEFSCGELCTSHAVTDRKREIFEMFAKWKDDSLAEQIPAVQSATKEIAAYLTKYTDYLANEKVPVKDLSISREYTEMFKWDTGEAYREHLRNGAVLIKRIFESDEFWEQLKKNHSTLKEKYLFNKDLDTRFSKQIKHIETQIQEKYEKYRTSRLTKNLDELWDIQSLNTFKSHEGMVLRSSQSKEETIKFLIKCAKEVFCSWANWMNTNLPGCKVAQQIDSLEIGERIERMVTAKEITKAHEGWKKITDMLRASYTCTTAGTALSILSILEKADKDTIKLLRIIPRFGAQCDYQNDILINFDFRGQMICELLIKMSPKSTPNPLYRSYNLISEIEKICGAQDRQKLLDRYDSALAYRSKHGQTVDSCLTAKCKHGTELEVDEQEDRKKRNILKEQIPAMQNILDSQTPKFKAVLKEQEAVLSDNFWEYMRQEYNYRDRIIQAGTQNFDNCSWDAESAKKFVELLFDKNVIDQEQYDAKITHFNDDVNGIAAKLKDANCYPFQPSDKVKQLRELFPFDYTKLIKEGKMPKRTDNDFDVLKDIWIPPYTVNQWQYYGQVDKETGKKPDGIGMAVSGDGKMIIEGGFFDGALTPVYRCACEMAPNNIFYRLYIRSNENTTYEIRFYKCFYKDQIIFQEAVSLTQVRDPGQNRVIEESQDVTEEELQAMGFDVSEYFIFKSKQTHTENVDGKEGRWYS